MDENTTNTATMSNNPACTELSQKRHKVGTKQIKNQGSSEVWTHMNRHMLDGIFIGTCDCVYCGAKFNCPSKFSFEVANVQKMCIRRKNNIKEKCMP